MRLGKISRNKMNKEEQAYLDLMANILENGSERSDRTGVGTKSIFGTMLRFDLSNGTLPVITTKKTFYRGAIEEMLFFIRGETDTKKLEAKGVNIWKGNTAKTNGEMGRMYGSQWRRWRAYDQGGHDPGSDFDQLQTIFDGIRSDPYSRRHVISAWNVQDLDNGVLYPCHTMFQFYVEDGTLSCMWQQRSVDTLLGLPFNIIGYAFLTHAMAAATGLTVKEVIFCGGDCHIYNTHIEQVKEQISREPYPFPKMKIKKPIASLQDIEALQFEDLEITEYQHYGALPAPMAV
jgi:thymidylate synthase